MSFRAKTPMITTKNMMTSNPPRLTPACPLLCATLIFFLPTAASAERSEASQLVQVEPDEECLADDVLVRHESPHAAVARIVPVVTQQEVMAGRNRAPH